MTLTAHRPGCGFLEDLIECAGGPVYEEPAPPAPREPGTAEMALAATYERYADELAAIEAIRSGHAEPGQDPGA